MGAVLDRMRGRRAIEYAIALAAGAVLLLASLANFLTHNDYPYFRPEVGLLALAVVGVSAAMAGLYMGQRQWGRAVLEGLLAALFADLNTNSVPLIVAAGLGVASITAWRRVSLLGPMAVLGIIVLLTTIVGLGGRSSWMRTISGDHGGGGARLSNQPAVVHLILDEHLGVEGLPNDDEGRRLRNELRSFYLESGFSLYGGAYSQHYHSSNAIPYMLNYGGRLGQQRFGMRGVDVGSTRHLQSLVDKGYSLTIFQSDFADFCKGTRFRECVTYSSYALRPTLAVPMTARERARLIVQKMLALSTIFHLHFIGLNTAAVQARGIGVPAPLLNPQFGQSSTVATLEAMGDLTNRLRAMQAGDALIAHLLLPHHPYVTRADCSYLGAGSWESLRTTAPMEKKRRAYYEQMRCTNRKVESLLRALSHSPAGMNSVVIVHGDHGSRMAKVIPREKAIGRFDDEDLIAVFSTLFAVRAPGVSPRYSNERQPVSALLHDFAVSGFRSAPQPKAPQRPTVFLTDEDWEPVRAIELPRSWTGTAHPAAGQVAQGRVSP